MNRPTRSVLTLAVAAAFAFGSAGVAEAITTIDGLARTWSPTSVTISAGHSVKWTAVSGNHHIKAYGRNWSWSRSLDSGTSRRHTFNSTGTFRFFCTIHGSVSGGVCTGMCGKVVVR
jgi:plastocyanin